MKAAIIILQGALAMSPTAPPVSDALSPIGPQGVRLEGWLAPRVDANTRRLLSVDLEPLLAGFRRKPGSHPWIGEHIGKWMHAATLAWQYAEGDTKTQLRAKLDYAAAELVKAQEPDGYLGTYTTDKRFGLHPHADWDVWSHKYCILGLVAYSTATGRGGDAPALAAARRAADLLIATFGPGKRSIITAGTHVGMAATSVIEPIVLLYNATGDRTYLDFALHVVKSYDDPNGPKLLDSLLTHGDVAKTANAKAYEMLSNCVGLCELYRVTADRRFLDAARRAFDDVVASQLYITGTASHHEHFHADHDLPNVTSANVGETCVTVTWIQLCDHLLRLTGDAKYAHELERSIYNHLAAAQHPTRGDWCYYTSLDGAKPYTSDTCCCLSSGPRAVSMIPSQVFLQESDHTLVVNLFEAASATCTLDGAPVGVRLDTGAPRRGGAVLTLTPPASGAQFAIKVRQPAWTELTLPGREPPRRSDGWLIIPSQRWRPGDSLRIDFALAPRFAAGAHANAGKSAATYGPLVLCYDEALNPDLPPSLVWLTAETTGVDPNDPLGVNVTATALSPRRSGPFSVHLVPFASAGSSGSRCRVWLGAPGALDPSRFSLLCAGAESRSAQGNVDGSINDADPHTFVVTFDNKRRAEDWFAVETTEPVEFSRIVLTHGRTFHDGGWFDASAAPPRIEIKTDPKSDWQLLAPLSSYPRTTATDPANLKSGESFELRLPKPARASAVRIVGTPAHGDNPRQAFASCAELAVFP